MSEALVKKAEKGIKPVLTVLKEKFREAKPSELVDLLINGGLAYLGVRAFKPETTPHFVSSALWGPVSLKLAQSESEAAGIVGGAGLLTLGVVESINIIGDVLAGTGAVTVPVIMVGGEPTCPEGYRLVTLPGDHSFCMKM